VTGQAFLPRLRFEPDIDIVAFCVMLESKRRGEQCVSRLLGLGCPILKPTIPAKAGAQNTGRGVSD
jgi:hypothetical protein